MVGERQMCTSVQLVGCARLDYRFNVSINFLVYCKMSACQQHVRGMLLSIEMCSWSLSHLPEKGLKRIDQDSEMPLSPDTVFSSYKRHLC